MMSVRRTMAEITASLPTAQSVELEEAHAALPGRLQRAIESDESFGTVRLLVNNGFGELGLLVAAEVQADLLNQGGLVHS